MDHSNPDYSVVRDCEDGNRAQRTGRMFAVALVLGVVCFTGVRQGRRSGDGLSGEDD
jgi:hypothetical protein